MSRQFFKTIGIESFGFYTPRYSLDIEELARLRQVDPKKFTDGLLLREMRIPEVGEDIITMSLKASQNALLRGNINPKQIDAIFVGTETVTYAVKSVSNILAEILGVSVNSITQDIYNACAGATLALLNAVGLIESGVIKKALVIAADISSYKLGSPGESTQGAGASAIIISANPRIAQFSKKFGKYSGNVNDFFRAVGDTDAQVFGKYSIESYLKFQMGAFDDLVHNLGEFHANFYAFHAPFSKLPLKIMQNLLVERSQHFLTHVLNLNLGVPRSRLTSRLP